MTKIHLREEDEAFIEQQVKDGRYVSADDVVTAGIRLLRRYNSNLRQLIKEGLDDIQAGRVHSYETPEEFLTDIKRISNERKAETGTSY